MTTERKVFIGIGLATLIIIVGGTFLTSKQNQRSGEPLIGEVVIDQGIDHVPDGTKVDYNSNPPTSGVHYADSQPSGIYDKPVPDGNLVHSMEHGAVILWYKSDMSATESAQLKSVFNSVAVSKKIMIPRDNLDVPVALTSWERLLKLQTIDEGQIKAFMEINEGRGPEQAPI